MEKNDLAMLRAENDRLQADMEKLKQRLREEITRTQVGVRLDLNLEKGRMREESSGQELKIKEVDTRIEQEIANLRTAIQVSKVSWPWSLAQCFGLTGWGRPPHYNIWLVSVGDRLSCKVWVLIASAVTDCSALLMAYLRFRM